MMRKLTCLFFALTPFFALAQPDIRVSKATGTGRTTGHIANLTLTNRGDESGQIRIGPFYIPSGGQYQPYIVPESTVATVPSGGTVNIPLSGYCVDIRTPPVPDGSDFPAFSSWVTSTPGATPDYTWIKDLPPSGATALPSGEITPYIPGTRDPIPSIIDFNDNPQQTGELLIHTVVRLEHVFDSLKTAGVIKTPFSRDPTREFESVIQQTFWIYTSAIQGQPYTKSQFEGNMLTQLVGNTGRKKEDLPETVQEQFDQGVDDFWSTFNLVGAEAKIISNPEKTEAPPVEIDEKEPPAEEELSDCGVESDVIYNPELDFDMKISESWGDKAERDKRIQSARESISKGENVSGKEVFEGYDIGEQPTSATAFWNSNHVGGFASAYAKTIFKKADGSTEWVWSTESLEAKGEGSNEFYMKFDHDEDCKSMVIGSSLSRIKASGRVFDAVAGNDPKSLPVLRAYTWLGKQAILFLIERKTGKTKDSFGNYLKDAATDEVKDALKEKLEEKGNEILDNILDELGIEGNAEDFEIPEKDDIEGMLEKILGIDIPSLEEGVDAAFDLMFYSNTYATAFGAMNITVGSKSGTVQALTRKLYLRQSLEDSKDAVTGTSDQCDELLLTDAQPGGLTIKTWGLSTMTSRAEGNGHAEASLESMHAEVLIGICICPGKKPLVEKASLYGWYAKNKAANQALFIKLRDDAAKHIQGKIDKGELKGASSSRQWSDALHQFMEKWAKENPLDWSNCKK